MRKKTWAQKASKRLDEGALTAQGWPSAEKLIKSARAGNRGIIMRRLNFIANMGNTHAKEIMRRIKEEVAEK